MREVARRVREALGERLIGVWLVGSAALDDYDPRRSDIDVQAVATERLASDERRALVGHLEHEALPNPARGLEFVLYARDELADPAGPRFQINLNTGERMEHHVAYDAGEDPRFWFTLDVSIARQRAVPLIGPPAEQVFPELPESLVAGAVLEGLEWYRRAPGAPDQALLSACRAWAWAGDRRWRSKAESARWALSRLKDPSPVERALLRRDGKPAIAPTPHEIDAVIARARAALAGIAPRR